LSRHVLLARHTEKRPRAGARIRFSDHISGLVWSRHDLEPAQVSVIAVDLEVFQFLQTMLPSLPYEKSRYVNE